MAAVFSDILDAVVTRLQSMTFTGLSSANIVKRKVPVDQNLTKPCIIVFPVQESMPPRGGTNERDDIMYGIGIIAQIASNRDPSTNLGQLLLWREQIAKALRNYRLTGIASLTGEQFIEPGPVIVENAWGQGWDVTVLTLRVGSRETRGIT